MIPAIFAEAGTSLTGFATFLSAGFDSVLELLYSGTAITAMGSLVVLSIVAPIVVSLLSWAIGLLKTIKFKAVKK